MGGGWQWEDPKLPLTHCVIPRKPFHLSVVLFFSAFISPTCQPFTARSVSYDISHSRSSAGASKLELIGNFAMKWIFIRKCGSVSVQFCSAVVGMLTQYTRKQIQIMTLKNALLKVVDHLQKELWSAPCPRIAIRLWVNWHSPLQLERQQVRNLNPSMHEEITCSFGGSCVCLCVCLY